MLQILSPFHVFTLMPHTHTYTHYFALAEFGLCIQISSKSSYIIYGKPSLTPLGWPLYCLKGIELQFFIVATVYLSISLTVSFTLVPRARVLECSEWSLISVYECVKKQMHNFQILLRKHKDH